MAYTALERMNQYNLDRFCVETGPFQPEKHFKEKGFDLKSAALRFLHNRCEGLKFDEKKEEEFKTGVFTGKSIKEDQIPFNMQMDINRLCLERELERFIDSGVAEDAYNIYYCYMEMFFGHYGKSKKMVELLSEFESNGSSLLMKHRDHYSHSVYVFALGLAIYETNSLFRKAFKEFYHFDADEKNEQQDKLAANFFLEFWGLASLFHDIGYPFELPFEQVLSYFEVDKKERGKGSVYIAYRDVSALTKMPFEVKEYFETLYGRVFKNTNDLFAYNVCQKLEDVYGISEQKLVSVLETKPMSPDSYGYFMDHAWFSATRLFQELTAPEVIPVKDENGDPMPDENGKPKKLVKYDGLNNIKKEHIDALTAILLHNSLYKFSIAFYKETKKDGTKKYPALKMSQHPLAYMLMLCDELQCWDRTAYGRNSRTELHPMSAEFDLSGNNIKVTYIYDTEESKKIDDYKEQYKNYLVSLVKYHKDLVEYYKNNDQDKDPGLKLPKAPKLKAYGSMYEAEQSFRTDIEKIVEINVKDGVGLTVLLKEDAVDRSAKHIYLSGSNFLHLYDFAVALNARYNHEGKEDEVSAKTIEKEFESLSLEYKLSNINQAKSFSRYLNAIGCFYTDKPVDFEMVTSFDGEQTATFAPMEHERWIVEHRWMSWKYGDFYEDKKALSKAPGCTVKDLREQMRMHKLVMDGDVSEAQIKEHYDNLSDDDKGKDWKPFNSMLKLIKKFDGLRIYKLN